jgi:pectinesterase
MKSILLAAALLLLAAAKPAAQTNLFVAADGSAPFQSVQEAIMAVPAGTRSNPVIIHIQPGTYRELIYIQREKRFFKLVGTDAEKTVLAFNLYVGITHAGGHPIGTFKTPATTMTRTISRRKT